MALSGSGVIASVAFGRIARLEGFESRGGQPEMTDPAMRRLGASVRSADVGQRSADVRHPWPGASA